MIREYKLTVEFGEKGEFYLFGMLFQFIKELKDIHGLDVTLMEIEDITPVNEEE